MDTWAVTWPCRCPSASLQRSAAPRCGSEAGRVSRPILLVKTGRRARRASAGGDATRPWLAGGHRSNRPSQPLWEKFFAEEAERTPPAYRPPEAGLHPRTPRFPWPRLSEASFCWGRSGQTPAVACPGEAALPAACLVWLMAVPLIT